MITLYGKNVFRDICIGKIYYYDKNEPRVERLNADNPEKEIELYREANKKAISQLKSLYDKALEDIGAENAAIFDAHRMILEDGEFIKSVEKMIADEKINAAYAVWQTGKKFAGMFQEMESSYMKERAADIEDVSERLIRLILAENKNNLDIDDSDRIMNFEEPIILAAKDLTPSETIRVPKDKLLGFMLEQGSPDSHTSILAKSMAIPAIVSIESIEGLKPYDGHTAILDGENGVAYIDPDEEMYSEYREKISKIQKRKKELSTLKGKESITLDGKKIRLYANVGNLWDVETAIMNDAEGIGLFRSEFLYLENNDFPTEEQQFNVYRQVLEKMGDKKVIIRTMDIGADKKADYFRLDDEENPALGYRAVRICLSSPEIFKTQLRALYRAGIYGNLSMLIPMIIAPEEILMVKEIAGQVKSELKQEGIAYKEEVEIGVMIETPAAALISDKLAKEADFFSIGTNDLSQYTLAIDRQNRNVQPFFNPHHDAIFKLIEMSAEAIHKEGKWIGVCGELGADTEVTERLIRIGIDEISVSPGVFLEVRKQIRESSSVGR